MLAWLIRARRWCLAVTTTHPRLAWSLAVAGVLALVAAVHAPTANDFFGGDDFMVLGPVRAMGPWELIWKSFLARDDIPYWRPLVSPLYAFAVHVFWLRPVPYHLIVIGLHLVNVALLALVAWWLTGRRWVALAAALLFGIHPAHTTTVPMISSTVELFSFIWYLAAVACCIRVARGSGRRWYLAGLGAFILGLLSKESVASAAGVITVLFFLLGRTDRTRFFLRIAPFWALVLPYALLTFRTNTDDPTGITQAMYSPGPHIGQNLWWFLARLAAPLEIGRGPTVTVAGHIGAAILVIAGLVVLLRGSAQARFLVLWTAIALTPLTLWLPALLVGRFTYMASAPFAVLLALAGAAAARRLSAALPRAVPRWAPAAALGAIAVLGLSVLTLEQNRERTREGESYRMLVATLRRDYPDLPSGSEVILEGGIWSGPFHAVFLNAVADTLYGPDRVRIRSAEPGAALPDRGRETLQLRYEGGALCEAAQRGD
jgi:hypothetical protein